MSVISEDAIAKGDHVVSKTEVVPVWMNGGGSVRQGNSINVDGTETTGPLLLNSVRSDANEREPATDPVEYASPFLRAFLGKRTVHTLSPASIEADASSSGNIAGSSSSSSSGIINEKRESDPTTGVQALAHDSGVPSPAHIDEVQVESQVPRSSDRVQRLVQIRGRADATRSSDGASPARSPTISAVSPTTARPVATTAAAVAAGASGLVPPYATEGGHVPISLMSHGRIQKRNWVYRNSNWCEMCKEPVDSWVNHHGRKDHALLDMHYTALVEFSRRWNPEALLEDLCRVELKMDIGGIHRVYARVNDCERRCELYAMLAKLEEEKLLHFGEPRQTFLSRMQGGMRGMDLQGALVMHQFILGPFMRLYPDGHIQDYSNLVDFVTCSYNMETVYDLCGLYTLDKVAIRSDFKPSSPAALGLGGIAAHSSASTGFQHDVRGSLRSGGDAGAPAAVAVTAAQRSKAAAAAAAQAELDEEAFSRKAVFVRQLLGQLRWVTQPGQTHPAGFQFPSHIVQLAEICLHALVAEIVCVRLCEYMVRAEPVWRDHGYERMKRDVKRIISARKDIVPEPIKFFYRPMSPKMDDLYCPSEKKSSTQQQQQSRLQQILQ